MPEPERTFTATVQRPTPVELLVHPIGQPASSAWVATAEDLAAFNLRTREQVLDRFRLLLGESYGCTRGLHPDGTGGAEDDPVDLDSDDFGTEHPVGRLVEYILGEYVAGYTHMPDVHDLRWLGLALRDADRRALDRDDFGDDLWGGG